MHKLIIEDDEGKSVVVPLVRDEITIGRQEGNTIRLTEQNISRRHARLFKQGSTLFVEDLGSLNGVRVNGSRIQVKQSLRDGDEVAIGDYKLGIRAESAAAASKPAGATPTPAPVSVGASKPAGSGMDRTIGYGAQLPFSPAGEPRDPRAVQAAAAQQRMAATAPVPEEALEGQPTIPVRTLAEEERASQSHDVPPARLQVIGGPLAGSEFFIDRASLVIGRTPENDIVLNHKSISRHHAKLISDGNDFIIVDLESANGVRVNGTKEERVQLDPGDVIELGHVRMRFVVGTGAGGPASAGRRRKPLFVAAGAAAAVLVVGIALALSGGSQPERAAVTEAPVTAPGGPTPAARPASELIAQAEGALASQDWDAAARLLRQAADQEPGAPRLAELAAQVEREQQAARALASLRAAADTGDLSGARRSAASIAPGTRAAEAAPGLLEIARTRYLTAVVQRARDARESGDCGEATRQAEIALTEVPTLAEARDVVSACRKTAAAVTLATRAERAEAAPARPRSVAAAAPSRPAPAPAARAPEPEPTGDPDEFIKQAQDAWLRGQYAAAIEAARGALKVKPGLMRAYQIIAVCSCSLRDQDGAGRAYAQLDSRNKGLVKSLCQKNGIELD